MLRSGMALMSGAMLVDMQVEKRASSLNSSDVFVLCQKDNVTVWYGRHGSKDERQDGKGEMLACWERSELVVRGRGEGAICRLRCVRPAHGSRTKAIQQGPVSSEAKNLRQMHLRPLEILIQIRYCA